MNNSKQQWQQLLEQQHWTEAERQQISHYLETGSVSDWMELLQQQFAENIRVQQPEDAAAAQALLEKIHTKLQPAEPLIIPFSRRKVFARMAAAAVLLLAVAAVYLLRQEKQVTTQPIAIRTDIGPGGNKAVLTLDNGQQIVLSNTADSITTAGGIQVVNLGNGLLSYAGSTAATGFHTLTTPKGGQFQVILPDGSHVWLNAATTLRYPASFTGAAREVTINGEAYFEIAQNRNAPFTVNTKEQTVEVLGTQFNINAYANETVVKTTLLEGSIRTAPAALNTKQNGIVLQPGQQVSLQRQANAQQRISQLDQSGLDKVTAWKNGLFNFEGVKLEEVMKQLERWYDINVVYEQAVPEIEFFGEISRNASLSGVLKALQDAGVNFRMEEGKRLVIGR